MIFFGKKENKQKFYIKIAVLLAALAIALTPSFAAVANAQNTPEEAKSLNTSNSETVVDEHLVSDTFTLTAKATNFESIVLTWEKQADVTGYIIYKYDIAEQAFKPLTTINDINTVTYEDKNLTAGTTYTYQVTPIVALPTQTNSTIAKVTAKSAVPEVKVTTYEASASLSWSKVEGAKEYEVYRSTSKTEGFEKIDTVKDTSFSDGHLKGGTAYHYKVRAVNGDEVSSLSKVASTKKISERTATAILNGDCKFVWPAPAAGCINSGFGGRTSPGGIGSSNHKGVDMTCSYGSSIVAALDGTVCEVSSSGARGNYVIINHGHGLKTLYQHLSSSDVSVGDTVKAGETIAAAGSTGISTGSHLHFEVWINDTPVNPAKYL